MRDEEIEKIRSRGEPEGMLFLIDGRSERLVGND